MKRTFIPLVLCALVGLLLVACGGSDSSSNSNTANTTTATSNKGNPPANNNNSSSTTTSTTTTSSGEKIGIAECDDFIAKYEACINGKVPEAQRAAYKSSIEQWRTSWRNLANNPQTKSTLAGVCKTQLEQSKANLKSFGCDF